MIDLKEFRALVAECEVPRVAALADADLAAVEGACGRLVAAGARCGAVDGHRIACVKAYLWFLDRWFFAAAGGPEPGSVAHARALAADAPARAAEQIAFETPGAVDTIAFAATDDRLEPVTPGPIQSAREALAVLAGILLMRRARFEVAARAAMVEAVAGARRRAPARGARVSVLDDDEQRRLAGQREGNRRRVERLAAALARCLAELPHGPACAQQEAPARPCNCWRVDATEAVGQIP